MPVKSALTRAIRRSIRLPDRAVSPNALLGALANGDTGKGAVGRAAVSRAVAAFPGSASVARWAVRALIADASSSGNSAELLASGDALLRRFPDFDSTYNVVAEAAAASVEAGGSLASASALIMDAAVTDPQHVLRVSQRLIQYLVDTDRGADAVAIAQDLAGAVPTAMSAGLLHATLLKIGDFDAAMAHAQCQDDPVLRSRWVADALLGRHACSEALTVLMTEKPVRPSAFSQRYVRALTTAGDWAALQRYLDGTTHNLPIAEEARLRFDAAWALGDEAASREALDTLMAEANDERGTIERVHRYVAVFPDRGLDLDVYVSIVRPPRNGMSAMAVKFAEACFDVDRTEEAYRVLAESKHVMRDATGRYLMARLQYVRGEFDAALELVDTIGASTGRHYDAEKLRGRILVEMGRFEEAVANRESNTRYSEGLDEVRYFGLNQLRRHDEAFALYADRVDAARLRQRFPDRYEEGPGFEHAASRFVISETGPGDEIRLASVYHSLQALSGRLTCTCEPRLQSLLERSFPQIAFVPVRRSWPQGFASADVSEAPRAEGPLKHLLTANAATLASAADRVVLGNSLHFLHRGPERSAPFEAYLSPKPELVKKWKNTFAHADNLPTVGFSWRSELMSATRRIHYLRLEDCADILSANVRFVCLQHDATPAEVELLERLCAVPPVMIEGISLRDDFEEVAALTASLDYAVGVGTAIMELVGAVGTAGSMIQPTHFGSWIRHTQDDTHFWHKSLTLLWSECARDPSPLVASARARIDAVEGQWSYPRTMDTS